MFLLSLSRSILFAIQSFWRNIWLSLATIFIITLTFISINFLVIISAVSDSAIEAVKEKIDISIYFQQEVNETKVAEIKSHLETLPQIKSITYSSSEDNLANFKTKHQDELLIQEALKELEKNPLGATLIVKAKQLDDYPEILEAIDNPAYSDLIEERSYDDHQVVIDRINAITENVRKGGLIISGLFVIIAALIVFNTVRIAIFTHRHEVGIMKLVGATNWFVRSPFIIENIFSGVIACVLAIGVVYFILSLIQPHLSSYFGGAEFNIIGYFNSNALVIFGSQLIGIIVLNIISSSLAIGKYLRV
ncbi:MAG TPA: permease-like cell division protein FtsX [bacterium]|nr:permease-like cell division protein FtsX [bacterium]HNS33756.1 permease-like cell division protein FtsX [bacterium]HNW09317.1 permease-like cell division protein FtsX [bacterium]HPN81414.1 permease-like cell division protein FtsX [bacterium]HPW39763.1 permease-like cell division protein FtsX [bacterium]